MLLESGKTRMRRWKLNARFGGGKRDLRGLYKCSNVKRVQRGGRLKKPETEENKGRRENKSSREVRIDETLLKFYWCL